MHVTRAVLLNNNLSLTISWWIFIYTREFCVKRELERMNDEFDYQCVTIYMNIRGKIAYPLHRKFRRTCTGDEHIMIIYQTHINIKAALEIHTFYASFLATGSFFMRIPLRGKFNEFKIVWRKFEILAENQNWNIFFWILKIIKINFEKITKKKSAIFFYFPSHIAHYLCCHLYKFFFIAHFPGKHFNLFKTSGCLFTHSTYIWRAIISHCQSIWCKWLILNIFIAT